MLAKGGGGREKLFGEDELDLTERKQATWWQVRNQKATEAAIESRRENHNSGCLADLVIYLGIYQTIKMLLNVPNVSPDYLGNPAASHSGFGEGC